MTNSSETNPQRNTVADVDTETGPQDDTETFEVQPAPDPGVPSNPQPVHTLNGTMVTDRALLAILENFGGEVPDALREYGAPERVER